MQTASNGSAPKYITIKDGSVVAVIPVALPKTEGQLIPMRIWTYACADIYFAGIASQLTVIVAYAINHPQYIRSLKPLVA